MAFSDSNEVISRHVQQISQANNHLAMQLYKILIKEDKNVFFSPFSISAALAMLLSGSESETAAEMNHVLGYEVANLNNKNVKSAFKDLFNVIGKNQEAYILACANSVLSDKNFVIKQDYKELLKEYFEAIIEDVDFANDSENAILRINNWVKEKTNEMILSIIDSLDPLTVMVLLNAVYFKGLWLHQFDKKDTYQQEFYNKGMENNVKLVDMMHLEGERFPYIEKESFKAIQLPYKGDEIAMIILLPNTMNGLSDLEASLTETSFEDLTQQMIEKKVNVALPNFRMECSSQLKEHLQKLGMKRIFAPGAQFGGISDSDKICVSEILHKAVVEVNEEGSEAAAVTAVVMVMLSISLDTDFIVDHPFIFTIYHLKKNMILFMGKVNEL